MAIGWLKDSTCLRPVRHISGLVGTRGIEDMARAPKALYRAEVNQGAAGGAEDTPLGVSSLAGM